MSYIAETWGQFYAWASIQPTFVQVALGVFGVPLAIYLLLAALMLIGSISDN